MNAIKATSKVVIEEQRETNESSRNRNFPRFNLITLTQLNADDISGSSQLVFDASGSKAIIANQCRAVISA
jgi:hypothetical protein